MSIFLPQIFNHVLEVVANVISQERKKFKNRKKKIKLSSFANDMSGHQENPKKLTIQSYKKKKKEEF